MRLSCGDVLRADRVVVAAGHATAGLPGVPVEALAGLHPVKGQILRLAPGSAPSSAPPLRHVVRGQVAGRAVYAVPYGDGRVAVGATSEDRDDLEVTAGAVHRLLDDALRLVPGLGELVLAETTARLRPATDAGVPVVAEVAAGVVVATGHGRHGVLLAPATAEAVTALVSGGVLPSWVPPPAAARPPLPDPRARREVVPDVGREVVPDVGREVVPDVGHDVVPDAVREVVPDVGREVVRAPENHGAPAVIVNGEPRPLPAGLTVAALLAQVAPAFTGGRGLAVAVDAEVVPRDRWDAVVLRGGEHVEVLTAIQGG